MVYPFFLRRSSQHNSGFTLIEVLIAIALIGIVASSILLAFGTSAKTLVITDAQETAKDVAITVMEDIRSQPYQDVYDITSSYTPPIGYIYDITITWLNLSEQRIDVSVPYQGKTFILTDYRVNY